MKINLWRVVVASFAAGVITTATLADGHCTPKCSGFYLGLGGTFSTIDENFKVFMRTNTDKSSLDLQNLFS